MTYFSSRAEKPLKSLPELETSVAPYASFNSSSSGSYLIREQISDFISLIEKWKLRLHLFTYLQG